MRLYTVATAYALWILGIFFVFYLVHGDNENALQLAVIAGLIPAACQIFVLGIDWRGLVVPAKIWIALVLVILVSYVVNAMDPRTAPTDLGEGVIPPAWTPIVFTFNALFLLGIGTLVAGCPDRRLLRSIAGIYCILAVPFLVYIDLTGERTWGRLTAGLQSIMWGLEGLTVCLGAFARKLGVLAVGAFAVGVWSMLESSSRESLLAVAVTLLVITPLYVQQMDQHRVLGALAAFCVISVCVMVLLDPYVLNAIHYVSHDVLLTDSPERGVNSGFTGRTSIWAETIDLWLKSPLVGIGFRQHEQFIAVPAHNAYLAMLADTGILGFIVYVVLLVWSLVAAWGIKDQQTRRFVVAMLVAYIVNGFFDRRTINAGNPFGVLFVLCCSVALVDQSLRKAGARWRKSLDRARDAPLPTG